MKYALLYIILLSGGTTAAQQYTNITSDWCIRGLKGKVRQEKAAYYLAASTKDGHYTINKSIIKFSKDGYITKVMRRIDGDNRFTEEYFYFSSTDKAKGYIKKWQRGPTKTQDSVVNEILSDTSFIVHSYNLEYGYEETIKYVFNKQQQLIQHDGKLRDAKGYKMYYEYDSLGHVSKETNSYNKGNFNVSTVFDVQKTDSMNNPTFIVDTFQSTKPVMISRQNISYTYYE